jgi:exosortase N
MDISFSYPKLSIGSEKVFLILLISVAIVGGIIAFPVAFLTRSNELIGICLLPFVINIHNGKRLNHLFLLLLILFGIAAFVYGVRMFYFFALAFYILWLVEMFIGRINTLTIFLLAFMSPFFSQVSAILGFPIRLQLSQLAGILLECIGLDIQIDGNMLLLDGAVFTVDDACMGLNMLAISMLMGVFILAFHSKSERKSLRLNFLALFFFSGLLFNVIANLFRIVILVLFKIPPENPLHEVIGILCLLVYVLIPLYLLGQWMVFKYGGSSATYVNKISIHTLGKFALIMVAVSILATGIRLNEMRTQSVPQHANVRLPGFDATEINDGVTKLVNNSVLVYVKPIPEFFTGEHTPLLCWKGSGYTFKSIGKTKINGKEIYIGQLIKKTEKLFTAWWYTNGRVQTISQLDWRTRMMKGEGKFSLVNVTAHDETELLKNVGMIFERDLLKISY